MNAAQCYIAGLIFFAASLLAIISAVRGRRRNEPIAFNFLLGKTLAPARNVMRAHSALLFVLAIVTELFAFSFLIRAMLV